MMSIRSISVVLALGAAILTSSAQALEPQEIKAPKTLATLPAELARWVPWVMGDFEWHRCPADYANGTNFCVWNTALDIAVEPKGGRFTQSVAMFGEGWVVLPGNTKFWPQDVKLKSGDAAAVSERDGRPAIFLEAGNYEISGQFKWNSVPEALPLPQDAGLVRLSVDGQPQPHFDVDDAHRLWLRNRAEKKVVPVKGEADGMVIKRFRKIIDGVPMQVETLAEIDVYGKAREETLHGMVLDGFSPMAVETVLPSRLESDGTLRVQVRAGHWQLRVTSGRAEPVDTLELPKDLPSNAKAESWVFEASPQLRVVDVKGAESIDPAQTELPPEWRNLPAYLMTPNTALTIAVLKRGLDEPEADDLSLKRVWRLDSAGHGYTVEDYLSGTIRKSWRLDAAETTKLGRVSINGQNQFITALEKEGAAGVEVRPGPLDLQAESRFEAGRNVLPAVGWDHGVQQLRAELRLPAGWSLFAASGVDSVSQSWVKNWQRLIDVFLVMVTFVAGYRLLGRKSGLVLGVALVLLHPELPALTGFALTIFGMMWLLSVLPQNKFRSFLVFTRRFALFLLLLMILPFMVEHVRDALYPQLRSSYYAGNVGGGMTANYGAGGMADSAMMQEGVTMEMAPAPAPIAVPMAKQMLRRGKAEMDGMVSSIVPGSSEAKNMVQQLYQYDPNSRVQTGYGVPQRQSNVIMLNWNGPVEADDSFTLWLISPSVNLLLALVRLVLLAVVFTFLLGIPLSDFKGKGLSKRAWQAFALLVFAGASLAAGLMPQAAYAQTTEYPPQEMLEDLRERVVAEMQEAPDCGTSCAVLAQARFITNPESLTLILQYHTGADATVVRLPGGVRAWRPANVLVDGVAAALVREAEDGFLQLALDKGVHEVVMSGAVSGLRDNLTFSFPLPSYYTQASGSGWDVQGIGPNGESEGSFQLVRVKSGDAAPLPKTDETPTLESRPLPAFFRVERVIDLGLSWNLITTVTRLTPRGEAAAIAVPLLDGESVTSSGVEVKNRTAMLRFGAQETSKQLQSVLQLVDQIALAASQDGNWVEVWRVNVSNIWHAEFSGINRMHTSNGADLPSWSPWPGEAVTLNIQRPHGVDGPTMTIDSSKLKLETGQRSLKALLDFTLRSSLGGQHAITLPDGAELQRVEVDGVAQPIQLKDGVLTLPVQPRAQSYHVEWQQPDGIATRFTAPQVKLNLPSVNSETEITVPYDRWVLFLRGPQIGPAVLIWGWVPVLLLLAYGLARVPNVPLKASHWFLLLLGLTQTGLTTILMVVGWVLTLGWRGQLQDMKASRWFNLRQVVLACWTLLAILLLFSGIKHGLLDSPDMRIVGNGSDSYRFLWYQDIAAGDALPQPSVLSLPHMVYKGLMLLWSLWLAFALMRWLRWGWECFSAGGMWRKSPPAVVAPVVPASAAPSPWKAGDTSPPLPEAPAPAADAPRKPDKPKKR